MMSDVFVLVSAGAEVVRLRPVAITHPEHPVNVARRKAQDTPGAVFADQFENLANLRAHRDTGWPLQPQHVNLQTYKACIELDCQPPSTFPWPLLTHQQRAFSPCVLPVCFEREE
jgi:hypothetical protein